MKRKVVVVSILLFVLLVGIRICVLGFDIKMIGSQEVKTQINQIYIDQSVQASWFNNECEVETINRVDINTMGTYYVKYKVKSPIPFITYSLTRKVIVTDLQIPKITFENGDVITVEYGDTFDLYDFKAIDDSDGDITDKVVIEGNVDYSKIGENIITYKVTDSFGNQGVYQRTINVVDTVKPEIKLNRPVDTYYIIGISKKLDMGYTVTDNYDENVDVSIIGDVDFSKDGKYTLIYTAIDSNNNTTILESTISVQKRKNTKGIPVLMYHWFYDVERNIKREDSTRNWIETKEFDKQMAYIASNNYYYATYQELVDFSDGKIDLPERTIIITDDDDHHSFWEIAVEILQKYKIPCTSFMATNLNFDFTDVYKVHCNDEYITIQAHSHDYHQRWGICKDKSKKQLVDDVRKCINIIHTNTAYAYPFGEYTNNYIAALKELDFICAFTTVDARVQRGQNHFTFPRVRISTTTSFETFKNLLS